MVDQKPYREMSDREKEEVRAQIQAYWNRYSMTKKGGILKQYDANKRQHWLYPHQVLAVNHLLSRDLDTPIDRRNASLLLIHEVGTGKTISSILAMAACLKTPWKYRQPNGLEVPYKGKVLAVVPKAVLEVWDETFDAWTNLKERGVLLKAEAQKDLTRDKIQTAAVIVTTPDTLVAAWKTFMYLAGPNEVMPDGKLAGTKREMDRWMHGSKPGSKQAELLGDAKPPVHPLYALINNAGEGPPPFVLTVVDEVHEGYKPTTQKGHLLRKFTRCSAYKLALTGTPVSAKPEEMPHLVTVLNAMPLALQKKAHYFLVNQGHTQVLNRDTINEFHAQLVDRVDASFLDLPERKILTLEYDPFVGKLEGEAIDPEIIARHNQILEEAQAAHRLSTGTRDELASGDSELGKAQRKCFTAVVRMGQFEFSSVLGMHGAKAFGKEQDPSGSLYEEAVSKPSQTMWLIARLIQSRQDACHVRVAVFCEKLTELEILKRFLERKGGFGELFILEGSLSAKKRNQYVHQFLGCAKGVFLFSKAGSVGITLCPGCEVLLSVGPLPWNATTIDQAFGRVYRIGQTKKVEIIQLVARNSVTAVKLSLHDDKRLRLAKVAADNNWENFKDEGGQWRLTDTILKECVPLARTGNYVDVNAIAQMTLWQEKYRQWEADKEQADANGVAPPPPPGPPPTAQALSYPAQMPLPPVSFPC